MQFDWTTNVFFCNSKPETLIVSFDKLATQSKAQMNLKFLKIETIVKSKVNQLLSALNQRDCRKKPMFEIEGKGIEEKKSKICRDSLY